MNPHLGKQLQLQSLLIKCMIIHSDSARSICFLHRPNKQIEWSSLGDHYPCISQVFNAGTNLYNQSRNMSLLLVCAFFFFFSLDRGHSSCFSLAFSKIIVFTPQVRQPIWQFCWLLHMSIPFVYPGTGEMTTG